MDHDALYWAGNTMSVASVLGSIFGFLPPLAALFAIIWYSIQIYESDTFQKFLDRYRAPPGD